MNTMACPPVIQRGLFPDSKERCLYFIQFKDCSFMGRFDIQLMPPTTWHYDEENPNKSYFEKGSENMHFPIRKCIIQHIQDGNCLIVAGRDGNFLIIGLAICPTDSECYLAISQEWSSDDDLLLKRKRDNQQKQKNDFKLEKHVDLIPK